MTGFDDLFYPDNKNRKRRAEQLLTQCEDYSKEIDIINQEIEDLLNSNETVKNLLTGINIDNFQYKIYDIIPDLLTLGPFIDAILGADKRSKLREAIRGLSKPRIELKYRIQTLEYNKQILVAIVNEINRIQEKAKRKNWSNIKLTSELEDAVDSAIEIALATNIKNTRETVLEDLKWKDKDTNAWTNEDPSGEELDYSVKELNAADQNYSFLNGEYKIVSVLDNNKALDVKDGKLNSYELSTHVQLWSWNNSSGQKWEFVFDFKHQAYKIKSKLNEDAILAWNRGNNEKNVFVTKDLNKPEHFWILQIDTHDYFILKNKADSSLALYIENKNTQNGTNVQLELLKNDNNSYLDAQKFLIISEVQETHIIDSWLKSYVDSDKKEHYHGLYFKKIDPVILAEIMFYEIKVNGNYLGNARSERYNPSEDGRLKVNFFEYNGYGFNHPVKGDRIKIWAVKKDHSTIKVIDTVIGN